MSLDQKKKFSIFIERNDTSYEYNLKLVSALFHRNDHIEVLIESDQNTKREYLEDLIDASSIFFKDQASYQIVNTCIEEHKENAQLILDDVSFSEEGLFRAYSDYVENSNLAVYENDNVVDMYDPYEIGKRRLEVSAYTGSTDFNKFKPYLGWLEKQLDQCSDKFRILDMGCGAGAFYFILEKYLTKEQFDKLDYTGVDISRMQIFRARQRFPNVKFLYGDAVAIDLKDNRYDCIFLHSVLAFNKAKVQLKILQGMAKLSNAKLFAGLATRSSDHMFPIREATIAEKLSRNTNSKQGVYYPLEQDLEKVCDGLGLNNIDREKQIYFDADSGATSLISETHFYYRLITDYLAKKVNAVPDRSNGCRGSFLDFGMGTFTEVNQIKIYPENYDAGPMSREIEDLNSLMDNLS